MKERIFVQKSKEQFGIKEFIKAKFANTKCSNVEVQHTPLMTRIIISTSTPGLIIGTGGQLIREAAEDAKKKFKLENPQIDIDKITTPDLDPYIVAKSIANSIKDGSNFKRIGNQYLNRIMSAGAMGCEILLSGKFAGQRGKKGRFTAGYLKKCGDTAEKNVLKGYATAIPKLGCVGITVKIMVKRNNLIADIDIDIDIDEEPKDDKTENYKVEAENVDKGDTSKVEEAESESNTEANEEARDQNGNIEIKKDT